MGLDTSFRKAGRALGLDVKALFDEFDSSRPLRQTVQGRGYGLTLRPQQRDAIATSLSFTPVGRFNKRQPSETETGGVNQEETTTSEENTGVEPEVATTRVSSYEELAQRYGFDRRIRGSRSGSGVYMPDNFPIAVDYIPDKTEEAEKDTNQTLAIDDSAIVTDYAPTLYRRVRGARSL